MPNRFQHGRPKRQLRHSMNSLSNNSTNVFMTNVLITSFVKIVS